MRTFAELAALRCAAESWIGTPFVPNSHIKGAGVCCHHFAAAVYAEAGWLPEFDLPRGNPYGSAASSTSPMEEWLDGSRFFTDVDPLRLVEVDAPTFLELSAQPGDLFLSRPGRMPWHLAIWLGDGVAHVCPRHGVQVTATWSTAWAHRIARIYRPHHA